MLYEIVQILQLVLYYAYRGHLVSDAYLYDSAVYFGHDCIVEM